MQKRICIFVLTIAFATTGWAQGANALESLKALLAQGKTADTAAVLEAALGKDDFAALEKFYMDEIKARIVADKTAEAKAMLSVLLSVNLENIEAQDLYANLVKLEKEKQKRLEADQARKAEEERLAREKAEKEAAEKKAAEQKAAEIKAKETYTEQVTNVGLQNFSLEASVSPAALPFYQSGGYDYFYQTSVGHWNYGLKAQGGARFDHPYVSAGADVSGYLSLAGFDAASARPQSFRAALYAGSPGLIGLPLFVRGGVTHLSYGQFAGVTNVLYPSLTSPLLGLEWRDQVLFLKPLTLRAGADCLLAAFTADPLDFALFWNAELRYQLMEWGKTAFFAGAALEQTLLFSSGRTENNTVLEIRAGVTVR